MSSRGFLVCADITGYTQYLSHSELEHATGILADLLRLLLAEVQAPLQLSRVEGDAVISYAPGGGFQGQLLVDRLDDSYIAFRRALDEMVHNTTCRCNACANIAELDLKFVVHHGEFAVQHLGQQDELVGPEVNLMFRLAKNRIRQALGLPGYIAFTPEALAALELPGFAEGLQDHVEVDAERGPIHLAVRDLRSVWEGGRNRAPVVIPAGEVIASGSHVVAATPEEVFTLLVLPETRTAIFMADATEVDRLPDGRIGPDAVYVCAHGDKTLRQVVIDWAPPERFAFSSRLPGGMNVTGTIRLEPVAAGTRVELKLGLARGVMAMMMRRPMRREMAGMVDHIFATLDSMAASRVS
jgi:uncharacterized protein YndB with AHSA1/START domain